MTAVSHERLITVAPGSHVCWVVEDPDTYVANAAEVLRKAADDHEKPVVFGPEHSAAFAALSPLAVLAADPRVAFLDGGPLDPGRMFSMFREQSAIARRDGYRRLRVVADMDWLAPARPSAEEIVSFELLLDRHARELDATVVCAYRTSTFDTNALEGALCVHPVAVGRDQTPQFRLVAGDGQSWTLSGELDLAVGPHFASGLTAAAGTGECTLNVSGLEFADVAALRTIALAGNSLGERLRLVGARPVLRRTWELAGFAAVAPSVDVSA